MSDFSTPFANDDGERRDPTSEEQQLGFPCGPADLHLFNQMFHRLHREVKVLAEEAGVTGDNADYNLLRDSVAALIAAATGGGDTSEYLLLTQARARLPFHADTQTTDGKLGVSSPAAGTVRVPGSVTFLHRGIYPVQTVQTDLTTTASKTYHLRWTQAGGFVLKDLADTGYNPSALAESAAAFDGTYDDVLFARVVTNASNIATITNLVNKPMLMATKSAEATNMAQAGQNFARGDIILSLEWARTPAMRSFAVMDRSIDGNDSDRHIYPLGGYGGSALNDYPVTRYGSSYTVMEDYATAFRVSASFGG